MGTTIKDIARDTNLSLATISKYLNGKKILPGIYPQQTGSDAQKPQDQHHLYPAACDQ